MKTLEIKGKTVEEAIESGLKELSASMENISYEVLQQPSRGFLGVFGVKPAIVKLSLKEKAVEVKEARIETTNTNLKDKKETSQYEVTAKKFLRDVLNNMNIMCEIHVEDTKEALKVNLVGPDMGILIGHRGETLDSLQYLLSLVVNKEHKDQKYKRVVIDTENYRKKREETLIRLANKLASKVKKTGKDVRLEPMNPYERRVIHSALQGSKAILTRSEGEEPYRRVVISLKK